LWGRSDGALAAGVVVPGGLVGGAREDARLAGLVDRLACGDEGALCEVYDETCSRVYGAVVRMLHYPELAGEVTREIYLQLWREASGFDPGRGSALAWIMTVAHNRCVDRVRTQSMDSARDRYAALNGDRVLDRAAAGAGHGPQADAAWQALGSLPPTQRQVLTLTYFAGFSQNEVAQLLELPLAAVASTLNHGLTGLREALGVGR
jgi:RNA polymerase sigma-70 factor, ECF subfamily